MYLTKIDRHCDLNLTSKLFGPDAIVIEVLLKEEKK